MATLSNGILGGGRNKVGPVIMSRWKGINYIRSYAKPSNPNTIAQQTVRVKFARLVDYARQILSTVIKPFWDPFYSDKSGFNAWISSNYNRLDSDNFLTQSSILAKGSLTNVFASNASYNSMTGNLLFTWSIPSQGDILSTDSICVAVYNTELGKFVTSGQTITVNTQSLNISIGQGVDPTNWLLFYFTYRGVGSGLNVSDSRSFLLSGE